MTRTKIRAQAQVPTRVEALARARYGRATFNRLLLAWAIAAPIAGCSKGAEVSGAPAPPPPAPSNATAYIGSQSPGTWTMSVDNLQNAFSYQTASGTNAESGGLLATNGVLDFGNKNGVPLGKAVVQPGSGALLRPGGVTTFPVAMIQQEDCVPLAAKTRYIYTALPGPMPQNGTEAAGSTGFGTFVVSSSSDGKNLSFTDVHNYVLTTFVGNRTTADTENGADPGLFSATCTSANGVGTVIADPTAPFPTSTSGTTAIPTFHFNQAGAFTEDRPTDENGGWVGFVMPSGSIKASTLASGTYRGFFSESTDKVTVDTEPVAFAQASDGTTNLVGGVFPNDDLAQAPGSEYTITLGTQDATYNGVFPNAQLIALDPSGICSSVALNDPTVRSSFDVNGNIICTAAGVAVVSQVNGKYVLYFTSRDGTKPALTPFSFIIQFYLYQQ